MLKGELAHLERKRQEKTSPRRPEVPTLGSLEEQPVRSKRRFQGDRRKLRAGVLQDTTEGAGILLRDVNMNSTA